MSQEMLLNAERKGRTGALYDLVITVELGHELNFRGTATDVLRARTCILLHIAAYWLAFSQKKRNRDSLNAAIAASEHLEQALPIHDTLDSATKKQSAQPPSGPGRSPGVRGLHGVALLAKARTQLMHQKTMPSWRLAPLEKSRSNPHLGNCADQIHAFLQLSRERRLQDFNKEMDERRDPWRTTFYTRTFPNHGWIVTRKGLHVDDWKKAPWPPKHATRLQAISHLLRFREMFHAEGLHETTVDELLENRENAGTTIRETDLMCLLPHLRVMRKLEAYQELRWLEPYLPDMQRMAEWL
jgi:hypothetical protein